MPTECSAERFDFGLVGRREVVGSFDGGAITSDAGALLLGTTDRAIGLVDRLAACFIDYRRPELIEHRVATLVGQRVFGIALGYEDLNDHDELRRDPVMAVLAGKLEAGRANCAPVAGKSTLNRLELSRETATRYHKIAADPNAIESLFVTLFLEAHKAPPEEIILDIDATDDPLHGHQKDGSSMAITIVTAICHCMCSAVGICWQPSCGRRISTLPPARWSRLPAS
jgi:Transposase DDE domain group 1